MPPHQGLGKTLQVLALTWTLLTQGPAGAGRPAVRRVVIVTPSTLVQNWAQEARKWLGDERVRVMQLAPGADGAQQARESTYPATQPPNHHPPTQPHAQPHGLKASKRCGPACSALRCDVIRRGPSKPAA